MRNHFAATRADLEAATNMIALHDPTAVWAEAVVKALSDASGRPVERLHLRENGTLRTLAMIERASTQLMLVHRIAARDMRFSDQIDEILTTAGDRHHVLRGVTSHRDLFVFAVLERPRSNLALARYRLLQAEQLLT